MTAVSRAVAVLAMLASPYVALAKEHHMTTLADLRHPHDLSAKTHAIELFVIPDDIDTRFTISPSKIETFRDVEKRTLSSSADRAAFFRALEAAVPERGTALSEFRIKAVLLDASGHRLAEIYSSYAQIAMLGDDIAFTFKHRNFLDFVEKTIASMPATHDAAK